MTSIDAGHEYINTFLFLWMQDILIDANEACYNVSEVFCTYRYFYRDFMIFLLEYIYIFFFYRKNILNERYYSRILYLKDNS